MSRVISPLTRYGRIRVALLLLVLIAAGGGVLNCSSGGNEEGEGDSLTTTATRAGVESPTIELDLVLYLSPGQIEGTVLIPENI